MSKLKKTTEMDRRNSKLGFQKVLRDAKILKTNKFLVDKRWILVMTPFFPTTPKMAAAMFPFVRN